MIMGEGVARGLGFGVDPGMQLRGGCRDPRAVSGSFSRPDCSEEFSRVHEGRVVFQVLVSTDSSGRRLIPGQVRDAGAQVVFFGCSITWGWGLESEQALPAVFQSKRRDLSVWNLAMEGFGPHDALVQMEQADDALRDIDRGKPTRAVVVMIPDHLARVAGDAYYVRTWGARHPRFVLDADGGLSRRGTFADDPVRRTVAAIQSRSQLFRGLAPRLKFNSDPYRARLTAAVLRELRRRFLLLFPDGDLTIVLFPNNNRLESRAIADAARADGLGVLDYSRFLKRSLARVDSHPDAETVARVAQALARDLKVVTTGL